MLLARRCCCLLSPALSPGFCTHFGQFSSFSGTIVTAVLLFIHWYQQRADLCPNPLAVASVVCDVANFCLFGFVLCSLSIKSIEMGASLHKPGHNSVHPPQPSAHAPVMSGRQTRAVSNASCPAQLGPRLSVSTYGRPAPPVWDPRSPGPARTPKKVAREIRASVIIQEQLVRQLAEQAAREEKEKEAMDRRKSTQLTNLPSHSENRGHLSKPRHSMFANPGPKLGVATGAGAGAGAGLGPLPTIFSPTAANGREDDDDDSSSDDSQSTDSGAAPDTGLPKPASDVETETGLADENPSGGAAPPPQAFMDSSADTAKPALAAVAAREPAAVL